MFGASIGYLATSVRWMGPSHATVEDVKACG